MDSVFEKKKIFIKLAKQLNPEKTKLFTSLVQEMYSLINMYCVTEDEQFLRLLFQLLCNCNTAITNMLIKEKNHYKLYCIKEIV
ncbi:unknown [Choristoneura occidentalis granulovirus]|uniref:Uncharacterized protein n=1 Tax=Choristoneura occidentalis granulovirus TaxID=364745 RepID=Q1A4R6_9BBAC|nr:unknown [Choristoneura fumiferana granulovirus]ABC61164.1 unknown [Choristoneura fumiferana granulovirus]